jgi:thiamine biosynthesis lipoprotein
MSHEAVERFGCFGGTCEVRVAGGDGRAAAARARERLLEWHDRFTRFAPESELSRLNADPRDAVPASEAMLALAEAIAAAGARTGGLVDGTLANEIEAAGYDRGMTRRDAGGVVMTRGDAGGVVMTRADRRAALPLALALRLAPRRRPAGPSPHARWRALVVDRRAGVVRRPPGVAIDSGGLAKGLFADLLATELAAHPGFVVNCAGDLRIGGTQPRPVRVAGPFGDAILHTFAVAAGAAATSGISARAWIDASGAPAHHLLDPATGSPAFTGVVQATALAPTALEAETRAKAALLSGPDGARRWLEPHGGVVVHDDGTHAVIAGTATA